jgi:hypothetical protein
MKYSIILARYLTIVNSINIHLLLYVVLFLTVNDLERTVEKLGTLEDSEQLRNRQ